MIIAQISDSHVTEGHPERAEALAACVHHINALTEPVDLVVHTGDLVHDATPLEYETVARILERLEKPWYVIPGNRDRRAPMTNAFPTDRLGTNEDGFLQYTIPGFPQQLIVLDTLDETSKLGTLCEQRFAHLEAMLAEDKTKPTALFMHHPPYDVVESDYPFQFDSRETVAHLEKILGNYTNVIRIFCGHSHRASEGRIAAVHASTIPSIALDLRWGFYGEDAETTPLYQIHRYEPKAGFVTSLQAADRSGQTLQAVSAS